MQRHSVDLLPRPGYGARCPCTAGRKLMEVFQVIDAATRERIAALFDDRLGQGIALAQRHSRRLAVLFMDHFKHVNDSVGYLIGD